MALNMEDEEVAESWEEAADSGVRASNTSRTHRLTVKLVKWHSFVIPALGCV